jgi:hypothetical protein
MSENAGPETNIEGDYRVVAGYLLNDLEQGIFPSPFSLDWLAKQSEHGRDCAELIIQVIEADPEIAQQYARIIDSNIDFGQCG